MTPLGAAAADLAEVEALVLRAGTSFYRGMKVLAADRRAAMYAIYAFCRIVDDVADEPGPLPDKIAGLATWRRRIAALYAGQADDAVTRVLLPAIRRFALREADFIAVIDGMQMDAETVIVAPTLAELDLYCDRVAAAVGRLSVRAFGDASADADTVAWHLGRALQLTNILRDVSEDAARGRLYLPQEWLLDAGVSSPLPLAGEGWVRGSLPGAGSTEYSAATNCAGQACGVAPHPGPLPEGEGVARPAPSFDPAVVLHHPGTALVCARMAAEAHRHFDHAHAAMARCARPAMRPARLMGASYHALLHRLERRGWTRLDQAVRVPKWQKLLIALRYAA